MRYDFHVSTSSWPVASLIGMNEISFDESEGRKGTLIIDFSYQGSGRTDKIDDVNIPLFLTNFALFLAEVRKGVVSPWYIEFAPFARGRMSEGNLQICQSLEGSFGAYLIDETSKIKLSVLESRVDQDITKFGRIKLNTKGSIS